MVDTRFYIGRTEHRYPQGHPAMVDRCLPFNVILYVDKGSYYVKMNGEWRKYLPGEAFVIPPFVRHDVRIDEDSTVTWAHISFSEHITKDVLSDFIFPDVIRGETAAKLRELCTQTVGFSESESILSDIELQRSLLSLLLFIIKIRGVFRKSSFEEKGDSPFRKSVFEYINNHLGSQIKVPDLAKALYMSETTLRRRFLSEFGVSPKIYIQEINLKYACSLLLSSPLSTPIEKIVEASGFGDIYYFNRIFKANFFMSPNEYRNNCYR